MAKKQSRRIEYMNLDDIVGARRNPKLHSLDDIKASYRRFSAQDSPVLDERTKRLLSGHGRVEALRALRDAGERPPGGIQTSGGKWLVPIQRGGRTKNDKEAEAYLLAANKLAEVGGWDTSVLDEILGEMLNFDGVGFDMKTSVDDVDAEEPPTNSDDALPRRKRKKFKIGQRKTVGEHAIVCSEWLPALKLMDDNSVDSIVSDSACIEDIQWAKWAAECHRVLRPGGHLVVFAKTMSSHRIAVSIEDSGIEIRDTISWIHRDATKKGELLRAVQEPIILARVPLEGTVAANVLAHGTGAINVDGCRVRGGDNSWPGPTDSQSKWPANIYACDRPKNNTDEKPVQLVRWILRLVTQPGGIVLDTFLGNGTVMVAAEREGFRCIGIEHDGENAALSETRVRGIIRA